MKGEDEINGFVDYSTISEVLCKLSRSRTFIETNSIGISGS